MPEKEILAKRKTITKIILAVVTLSIIVLFQAQIYRIFPSADIDNKFKNELFNLGAEAIKTKDIPVASILVYNDEIIGRGYNTVKRNQDITGHAEVNALNDAFKNLGEEFHSLDRNNLDLYTTLEPCPMCKGVLVNHNIYNIYFEADKPLLKRTKNTLKHLYYEFIKRKLENENIQESLIESFHKVHR